MQQECIINPVKGKKDPNLPESGLFCINPGDAEFLASGKGPFTVSEHYLFNSRLWILKNKENRREAFLAGPAVGAPMAVMCLEKFIALGASKVLVAGWCGSLHKKIRSGDVLLPSKGLSEEGTSAHYPLESATMAFSELHDKLKNRLSESCFNVHEGKVWTTDAPYRETREKVSNYASRDILGVDMEFTALRRVAAFRNIELATALLVSDELWHDSWEPAFTSIEFRKNNRFFLELLREMLLEN